MPKSVEFFFDYGSPASHLAFFELRRIARAAGAAILWRPILLGGVFKAINSHSPVEIAPKGKWMMWDLANHAERYGVPFVHNPHFVINTLPIMRGAIVAERRGELERYSEAMFFAIWRDAFDMDDPAVIERALVNNGFDAKAYFAGVQEDAVKAGLKARTDEAVARGVFGLPTFIIGEKMWWGQDRLEWVKDALAV
jgi:2-hydroxychromene-2-carboxylate isomerase